MPALLEATEPRTGAVAFQVELLGRAQKLRHLETVVRMIGVGRGWVRVEVGGRLDFTVRLAWWAGAPSGCCA